MRDKKLVGLEGQRIIQQARKEVAEERFKEAVEKEKDRIRRGKWWHKLLPFTITITRRD